MPFSSFTDSTTTARQIRQKRFFSVVIPLYNKEQSIGIALNSVLSQTHETFEVVVIDDGSTDASASTVAAARDKRVRLIRQTNAGVSAARNSGVKHARSDYIAFLDADDYWQPDFLATIDRLVDMNPTAGLFATAFEAEQQDGQIVKPKLEARVAAMAPGQLQNYFRAAAFGHGLPFHSSSICVFRPAFEAVGGFKHGVKYGEDLDLFARLALRYPVMFTPQPKIIYRCTAENRALASGLPLTPWVFHEEARRVLACGSLPPNIARDVIEHVAAVDLYAARTNLLNPDRKAVLRFLRGIKTRSLVGAKLAIALFMLLPLPLRKTIFAARRKLRTLANGAASGFRRAGDTSRRIGPKSSFTAEPVE